MVQYETLILSIPEITNDETKQLEKQFDSMVQKSKGAIISFDRWGKYKLAQQVNKNNYGVYFLARFEVPAENKDAVLDTISEHFKLKMANIVMRFMNSVLDTKQGLEYTKPAPLDESARDVDKFLKDNKMDSFVGKKSEDKKEAAATEETPAKEEAPVEADKKEETEAATEEPKAEEA